ncbi:hypothetical protein T492DRAFT_834402 [Pavlovales sp. CCMP2436]|nr:hypothetical protein T492DRAFT_834402 [Pavlovales sp. CCMP2436]
MYLSSLHGWRLLPIYRLLPRTAEARHWSRARSYPERNWLATDPFPRKPADATDYFPRKPSAQAIKATAAAKGSHGDGDVAKPAKASSAVKPAASTLDSAGNNDTISITITNSV